MTARSIAVLTLLLISPLVRPALAQTADEVVERHLAALGGREALGKLTSQRSTGTVTITSDAGDLSGAFEQSAKAPNKLRVHMKLDLSQLGMPDPLVVEQKFDATAGLMLNSLQGTSEITGNQLENMRNSAFPNPLTDICWSCILPISVGSATVANFDGQEDTPNPASPVCSCGVNPTIGLSIGFWEPARHVEVVRKPFCLVSMGGIDLDPGIAAPAAARFTRPEGDGDGGSFYQATWSIYSDRGGRHSLHSFDAEATRYIPLASANWVLALRGWTVLSHVAAGKEVPFYLMPNVGGRNGRGYRDYRFHDRNMQSYSVESRWAIFDHVDAALFVDLGNVAASPRDDALTETTRACSIPAA